MTTEQWALAAIVLVPLAVVATNRLRIDLAAILMAVCLGILQLLGLGMLGPANSPAAAVNLLSGFSQPIITILISLFVLTRLLEKSGVTRWIARRVLAQGRGGEARLILVLAATSAALSLIMNNLAAGALVLPIAMDAARRAKRNPSRLLIPVAYGSLLGGTATYFTSANIIVSTLLLGAKPPQAGLGFLDFVPTGGLIVLAGLAFIAFAGPKLLPNRPPTEEQSLVRLTGTELEEVYDLGDRLWEARVGRSSPLVGKTLDSSGIGQRLGIVVAAKRRGREAFFIPGSTEVFLPHDVLLVVGREERVRQLESLGLRLTIERQALTKFGLSLTEATPAPRSACLGKTLKEINFRGHYGFAVVALLRRRRSFRTDIGDMPLQPGDLLLLVGPSQQLTGLHRGSDFIVFEPNLNDLPVDWRRAIPAILIVGASVVASVAGVPVYLAMLGGAVSALLLRTLTMDEAYAAIEWQAIFLIAGMYAVSYAMVETHLADRFGSAMLGTVLPLGPLGLAAGAYLLTAVLTQVMGGQVAALVSGPVTISAAIQMGVSPQAIAVATAVGCSASFFTPMAHPVNIIMIAPGNYTFGDFMRNGWPLTLVSFAMLLVGMIVFWGL